MSGRLSDSLIVCSYLFISPSTPWIGLCLIISYPIAVILISFPMFSPSSWLSSGRVRAPSGLDTQKYFLKKKNYLYWFSVGKVSIPDKSVKVFFKKSIFNLKMNINWCKFKKTTFLINFSIFRHSEIFFEKEKISLLRSIGKSVDFWQIVWNYFF